MFNFRRSWLFVMLMTLALTASGCIMDFGICDETEARQDSISADGITSVRIIGRAGDLHVAGQEGATEISVSGTACAPRTNLLDQIELQLERRGSEVWIEAIVPTFNNLQLDFQVDLPTGLAVMVEDSSGEVRIQNTGPVRIDDDSGDIVIQQIVGDVRLNDDSGDLEVRGVTGNVLVEDDNSGDLEITDVSGDVVIEQDGSGGIEIAHVGGSVTIRDDGSGGIDVWDIQGDFTVEEDGSGDIEYREVGGRIRVP